MIFSADHLKLVVQGKKSMCRRPIGTYRPPKHLPRLTSAGTKQITVLMVYDEPLGQISIPDAKREGYRTTEAFLDDWEVRYHRRDLDERVWVISFRLGDWTDTPRLLAARPGGPGGDYTTIPAHAAMGEPEAIGAPLLARYAADAHERDKARKPPAQSNTMRERERRIAREQRALARERGVLSPSAV